MPAANVPTSAKMSMADPRLTVGMTPSEVEFAALILSRSAATRASHDSPDCTVSSV